MVLHRFLFLPKTKNPACYAGRNFNKNYRPNSNFGKKVWIWENLVAKQAGTLAMAPKFIFP